MNDEHVFWSRRLDEYIDGELDAAGVAEVEGHLAGCASCREELEWLSELGQRTRELPAEVIPTRDLWRGIGERIARGGEGALPERVFAGESAPRGSISRRWLAVAAAVLVIASSGTTALLLRSAGTEAARAAAPRPVGLAAFAASEGEYRNTVDELRRELETARPQLQPETIAAVEQNLAIIDQAIAEARAALAADPLNADLPLLLAGVYRQKVELLRTAVTLPRT